MKEKLITFYKNNPKKSIGILSGLGIVAGTWMIWGFGPALKLLGFLTNFI